MTVRRKAFHNRHVKFVSTINLLMFMIVVHCDF